MKYLMALCLVGSLLLATAFAEACPVGGPCTCPRPGQAAIVTDIVENPMGAAIVTDLGAVATVAVNAASAECDRNIERAALLGPPTETVCFGILNTLAVLSDLGISNADLMPLARAQERISEALEVAKPANLRGMTIAKYALVLGAEGKGRPYQLFQAASLLCRANVHFKKAADTLEAAQVDVAEAKAIALALFKRLEDPPEREPVDTDDAYDVD
jgi:hypothetical protein